jgi:hypothetical protein
MDLFISIFLPWFAGMRNWPTAIEITGSTDAQCLRLERQNIDFCQDVAQGADQRVSKSMLVVNEIVKLLASRTYR